MRRLRAICLLLGLTGCATWHAEPLPEPVSPTVRGTGRLLAGVARVEITPPVGLGLGGSGPEGRRSTGYRTRLFASALVLEDADGERVALVVLDLAHVSPNLHRLAADRLARSDSIGADRLVLSATHTHSGPAHFYAERQYNSTVSRVGGFDPRFVDFLVSRVVEAVHAATRDLQPAVAASGTITIAGVSENRSLDPYCQNPEVNGKTVCTDSLRAEAVDSQLVMLRVDRIRARGNVPLGSYSVFAIHGTAIPSANTLYDGDVHVRIINRFTDSVNAMGTPGTVHALANGTEGDVSPTIPRDPSCATPQIAVVDPLVTPRGGGTLTAGGVDFIEPPADAVRRCIDDALIKVDRLAGTIAGRMLTLYNQLPGKFTADVPIRRAFTTIRLPGVGGLCPSPVMGAGGAGGAEGAETRIRGWQWIFPAIRLAADEGGKAVKEDPSACQSPKRGLLEPMQSKLIVGEHGFPEVAQLTVFRIGTALFAALPWEVTTIAGRRIKEGMRQSLAGSAWKPDETAVISLADGFLQYVTTREEYGRQHYEGSSTLYGPGTAAMLTRRLAALAASLPITAPSPPVTVAAITAYPGPPTEILPMPRSTLISNTGALELSCRGQILSATWRDNLPGDLFPRDGRLLELYDQTNAATPIAIDGDGFLEIQLRKQHGNDANWAVYWKGIQPGRTYRLVRLGPTPADNREGTCTITP